MSIPVLIAGVNRKPKVGSVRVSRRLYGRGSARMIFESADGSYVPTEGQQVEIYQPLGPRVFGGHIARVESERMGQSAAVTSLIECNSWEARLERRFIKAKTYEGMTCGAIVTDIFTNIIQNEVTLGTIEAGATVDKVVYGLSGPVRASDALTDLCERNNPPFWWAIDANLNLHFRARTAVSAPFNITDTGDMLDHIFAARVSDEYRNSQFIKVAWAALEARRETYAGNGAATVFNTLVPIAAVDQILKVTNTKASAVLTFTGVPAADGTVTIDGTVYTFKTSLLSAGTPRQVKIGATAADCAKNLYHAINDTGTGKGTGPSARYSPATLMHPSCEAVDPGAGAALTVRYKTGGVIGNGKAVSRTATNCSWSAGTLGGGADGQILEQSFGAEGDAGRDWYWTPGKTTVTQDAAGVVLAATDLLDITYRGLGEDVIELFDQTEITARAAIVGGSGIYSHFIDDSQNMSATAAIAKADAVRQAKQVIPHRVRIRTQKDGLDVGQLMSINLTKPAINTSVLITELDMESEGGDVFRYEFTAESNALEDWVQSWRRFVEDTRIGPGTGPVQSTGDQKAPDVTGLSISEGPWIAPDGTPMSQIVCAYTEPAATTTFDKLHLYMVRDAQIVTINASMTSGQTTLPLAAAEFDPIGSVGYGKISIGAYYKLESEVIKVTAIDFSANTVTITRAELGTTAATHASGIGVFHKENPELKGAGDDSPIAFQVPVYNEVVRVYYVSVSKDGKENDILSSPSLTILVDGQVSAPTVVSNLACQELVDGLQLVWTHNKETDIDHYDVADMGDVTPANQAAVGDERIVGTVPGDPGATQAAIFQWQETLWTVNSNPSTTQVKVDGSGWRTNAHAGKNIRFTLTNNTYTVASNTSDTLTLNTTLNASDQGAGKDFLIGNNQHKFYVRAVNTSGQASAWRPDPPAVLDCTSPIGPDGTTDIGVATVQATPLFNGSYFANGRGYLSIRAVASSLNDDTKRNIQGIISWAVTVTYVPDGGVSTVKKYVIPASVSPDAVWSVADDAGYRSNGLSPALWTYTQWIYITDLPNVEITNVALVVTNWFGDSASVNIAAGPGTPPTPYYTGFRNVDLVESMAFSATPAFNLNKSETFEMTLTADITSITVPNASEGKTLKMILWQDATGGRKVTFPSSFKGVSNFELAPTPSTYTALVFHCKSSSELILMAPPITGAS